MQARPPKQKRPLGAILFVLLLLGGLVGGGLAWKVRASRAVATSTDAGAAPDADSFLAAYDEDSGSDEGEDVDLDDPDADVLDAALDAPAEAARPAFVPPKKKPPTKKPPIRKRRW